MNAVTFVEIGQPKSFSGDRMAGKLPETSAMFSAVLETFLTESGADSPDSHLSAKVIGKEVGGPEQAVEAVEPVSVATSPERVGKPVLKPSIRPVCTLGPMGYLDTGGKEAEVGGTPEGKFSVGRDEKTNGPPNLWQGLLPAAELIQVYTSSGKEPVAGGTAIGSAAPDAGIAPTDLSIEAAITIPAIQTSVAPIAFDRTRSDTTALPIETSPPDGGSDGNRRHRALASLPSSAAPASPEISGGRENIPTAMPTSSTAGFSAEPNAGESDGMEPIAPYPKDQIGAGDFAAAMQFGVRNSKIKAGQIPQAGTGNGPPELVENLGYWAEGIKAAPDERGLVADRAAFAHALRDPEKDAGPTAQLTLPTTENLAKDGPKRVDFDVDSAQSAAQLPKEHHSDQRGSSASGHNGDEAQPSRPRPDRPEAASANAVNSVNRVPAASATGSALFDQVTLSVNDSLGLMVTMPPLQGLGGHPPTHISPDSIRTNTPTLALPGDLGRVLAHAASQFTDRPVEVTLSPEELGRVRMTLATHDGNLTMAIQADRPETLDLLRRHIDSLAQDFRDMGFDDLNFSFGRDQDQRPQMPTIAAGSDDAAEESSRFGEPREPSPTPTTRAANAGLDLRM